MRLISILILLFLLSAWSQAHPLHLSITNITFENGMLKVSVKTFRDDWETAYFHFHGKVIDFTDDQQRKIPWFEKYLFDHFKLSVNKDVPDLVIEIDTITQEEDAMTIDMKCSIPSKANSLYIYNALLIDIFPDQTNLVIFGFEKKETGIKFDVKKKDAEVMLK
jgi:hypothetical protein